MFIAEGLGCSKALTALSLSHNNILDFGVEKIALAFDDDQFNIHHLNLAENNLTDKSGVALARVMLRNRTLRTVDLRHNDLTMKTGNLMRPVILNNFNLVKVQLEQNIIKIRMLETLAASCARNIAAKEKWDLRTLKKDVKTEKKTSGVSFVNSPELNELKEKLRGIPKRDHAYHLVTLQIEEAKTHTKFYQKKVDKFESELLREQVYENPELAELEERKNSLKQIVNSKRSIVREND